MPGTHLHNCVGAFAIIVQLGTWHPFLGCEAVAERFRDVGYETIVNIGELEENAICSNCGMYVTEERHP